MIIFHVILCVPNNTKKQYIPTENVKFRRISCTTISIVITQLFV